jgi:DNA-binding MarR family transcriptional regulator
MTYHSGFDRDWSRQRERLFARQFLHERDLRASFFPPTMFGETAWAALLALFSRDAGESLTVAEVAARIGDPETVTKRWFDFLEQQALTESRTDPLDPRRRIVELTTAGVSAVSAYIDAAMASRML